MGTDVPRVEQLSVRRKKSQELIVVCSGLHPALLASTKSISFSAYLENVSRRWKAAAIFADNVPKGLEIEMDVASVRCAIDRGRRGKSKFIFRL